MLISASNENKGQIRGVNIAEKIPLESTATLRCVFVLFATVLGSCTGACITLPFDLSVDPPVRLLLQVTGRDFNRNHSAYDPDTVLVESAGMGFAQRMSITQLLVLQQQLSDQSLQT
jgi:hypothetical protein